MDLITSVLKHTHRGRTALGQRDMGSDADRITGKLQRFKDLEDLLKQTEGKGINVYSHGEMLPTHGYPNLKKYKHFYGHYGTAWQNQAKEFADFPGPIVMTTNCIQRPKESYLTSIYTCGVVGWPGATNIKDRNFAPVIKKAQEMPGFAADTNGKSVMVGFARNAVMGVAGTVIEAVKNKAIKHFFLVAGCDGAKPGRNYYTEFVEGASSSAYRRRATVSASECPNARCA